jgi:hypothetical protein
MIDWNGNGKIDPVDIGISIAATQSETDDNECGNADAAMNPPIPKRTHLHNLRRY